MSLARLLFSTGFFGGIDGGGGGGGGGGTRPPWGAGATTVWQMRITFCAFFTLFSKFVVIFDRSSLAVSFTRLP